jgi:hypothetical protein
MGELEYVRKYNCIFCAILLDGVDCAFDDRFAGLDCEQSNKKYEEEIHATRR